MALRSKDASRRIQAWRCINPRQYCEENRRERQTVSRSGLYKRHVHGRHGLAAFLAVLVAVRRALHRVAALHGLLGRCHGSAIHRVPRDRCNQGQAQNLLRKMHPYQASRLERLSQGIRRAVVRALIPKKTPLGAHSAVFSMRFLTVDFVFRKASTRARG